jgi:carbonic anhydrase/acetyltransferase-like protein (isoleucine patch superfamily)
MTPYEHAGRQPQVDATTRVAPTAVIVGDVTIGAGCSVGFGAVIVAESGPARVAAHCVIMDTAVLRGTRKDALTIGENVLIGPRASLVGCTIEENGFIATGASIFNAAHIGARAEVQVNGIVHLRSRLPSDAVVPLGWIAVGDPAIVRPPTAHDDIWAIQKTLDFPGYVFGAQRPEPGETFVPDTMPRYAGGLGRWHADDREVSSLGGRERGPLGGET